MGFLMILIVAIIFSAGVFTLAPAPSTFRLRSERASAPASLREALLAAASAAGKRISGIRTAKRAEQARREVYSALSVLRNYASADGCAGAAGAAGTIGAAITTDCLLEQFAQTDGMLREAYGGALRLLRTGRRSEAAEYFSAAAGDPFAHDFILLVLDWDAVPPHKLKQSIGTFQSALKETRTTELMRKNEVVSDLLYLPVISGVLVVFVNFIYVAYFAEQRAMLAELFF